MAWLYAPGCVVSNKDYELPSDLSIGLSVTWRGKHMRPQFWQRAWKTKPWIRRLFGMICLPSVSEHCALDSMWSLPAFPVSRSRPRATGKAKKTLDGFGLISSESFATYDPGSSSWKMLQGSLFKDSTTYSDPWPVSGSMRNGIVSLRDTAEHPIAGDGYSSSRGWPTPTAGDSRSSGGRTESVNCHDGVSLTDATCRNGHRIPLTCDHGEECGPKLNPRFVEWLMGFPIGWTDFEPLATQSFQSWQRAHLLHWQAKGGSGEW